MKNTLLTIVAFIATSSLYAQKISVDSNETTSLKALKGNWATELNINPFKGELSFNNSLNQIKFRRFISDRSALRLGLNVNKIGSVDENSNPYGTNPTVYKSYKSSTTLGLNIGLEKHFAGTRRLSPFLGVDLSFSNKSSKHEITTGQVTTTIDGAWSGTGSNVVYIPNYNGTGGQYVTVATQQAEERAYFRYGVNLVSGFDFYMSRHFFFGYELNFGFNQTNYKDIKRTVTGDTGNTPPNNNADQKSNSLNIGPNLFNGIRLGYIL